MAYLVGPGAILAACGLLGTVITHLIVANHKKTLRMASRPVQPVEREAQDMPSEAEDKDSFPFESFGLRIPALDSIFRAWSTCMGRCVDMVTSSAIVIVVCIPLGGFLIFRVLMARTGYKVRVDVENVDPDGLRRGQYQGRFQLCFDLAMQMNPSDDNRFSAEEAMIIGVVLFLLGR